MRQDNAPSIIFGLYTRPHRYKQLIEELEKMNVQTREFRLIDVAFPPEDKDKVLNFFKHFIKPEYWEGRNPLNHNSFMAEQIKKQFTKATGYKPINLKGNFWKCDTRHKLLLTLAVPLFFQDTSDQATEEWEVKAIKEIETFTTKGYKPHIEIVKPEKMKKYKGKKEVI